MRNAFPVLALSLIASSCAYGQSAQPTGVAMSRTLMIKVKSDAGTMFAIHVDGRQYWVTAKHVLTGQPNGPVGEIREKTVAVEVLDPNREEDNWQSYEFDVIDPGKDIDIIVLAPRLPMPGFSTRSLRFDPDLQVGLGAECSFLGFPFAKTWIAKFTENSIFKFPFIKHCYVSGIVHGPPDLYILDGVNNPGFSGGPVLYNTGLQQRVIAVISGYMPEIGEVKTVEVEVPDAASTSNPQIPQQAPQAKKKTEKREFVVLNPGIIYAFGIDVAVRAIKKNPIGRPETESDTSLPVPNN